MKYLSRAFLSLSIVLIFCCCSRNEPEIVGIKIYDYNGDYDALTGKWKEMGINTAFVSSALAANDTFRSALRKRDISVFIIFPVFQNSELLKKDSSLFAVTAKGLKAKDEWVEFVCPSRNSYRKTKIDELADMVRSLDPDGISIDFIRQFVFWEMIYQERDPGTIDRACYCDSCLAMFCTHSHIIIPDSCKTTSLKAAWLDKNCTVAWNTFRCELITTMAKELSDAAKAIKPAIKINFHAVPWRDQDFNRANITVAAQDLRQVSQYVDYISPMCYSQMLKRDAAWISDVVDEMDRKSPGKILPSIQVYPYYVDKPFNNEDFKRCIEEAVRPPSLGVVFFSWPLFVKDSSRMDIVKGLLGRKTGS